MDLLNSYFPLPVRTWSVLSTDSNKETKWSPEGEKNTHTKQMQPRVPSWVLVPLQKPGASLMKPNGFLVSGCLVLQLAFSNVYTRKLLWTCPNNRIWDLRLRLSLNFPMSKHLQVYASCVWYVSPASFLSVVVVLLGALQLLKHGSPFPLVSVLFLE